MNTVESTDPDCGCRAIGGPAGSEKGKRMRRILVTVMVLVSGSIGLGAEEPPLLTFPMNGFSIRALEGVSEDATSRVVMMMLPRTEGFAPNVTVTIQPYDDSISDYAALTQDQFKAKGVTMIGEPQIDESAVAFEYMGSLQGRDLHWYARAEKQGGRVVLATATALESQWETVSDRLRSCVDSLTLN